MRDMPAPFYQRHIFMCVNRVDDPRCCGQRNGEALFLYCRKQAHTLGLKGVCVTKTGCMGRCMSGASLVIYPDNVWYTPRTTDDIDEILNRHVVGHEIIQRLLMPATEPPLTGYDTLLPVNP